jgi:hypothetical protein
MIDIDAAGDFVSADGWLQDVTTVRLNAKITGEMRMRRD